MSLQSVHFCFLLMFSCLLGRCYYDATIDFVQCHPVGNRHTGPLQWRCPSWAFQGLDNLCAADGFRAEDDLRTGDNLRTANDVLAEALCPADAYLCSPDDVRPEDNVRTEDDVRTHNHMCAQKSDLPTSDSHTSDDLRPADHERDCPNLCSWTHPEVRRRSEVILTHAIVVSMKAATT